MSGRLAAVSKHTIVDAIRERFGFPFSLFPTVMVLAVSLPVMAAELGGVALALQFVTGIAIQWWAVPIAVGAWLLLWKGTFGIVEQGVSLLGLVTLVFLVGAIRLHPDWRAVAHGLVPSLPSHGRAHYWFLAVSILGAAISPYLFIFYSSGAIEDRWDSSYLAMNRFTSGVGTLFGGALSLMVLVIAGAVLVPIVLGFDPLELTMISMALTAASLPVSVVPFLLLMNDERYVKEHTNGWFGNTAVALIVVISCVLAVVSIPLEIIGG